MSDYQRTTPPLPRRPLRSSSFSSLPNNASPPTTRLSAASPNGERKQLLRTNSDRRPPSYSSTNKGGGDVEEGNGSSGSGNGKAEVVLVERNSKTLVLSFVAMVLVGVGNRVFGKLETYPM